MLGVRMLGVRVLGVRVLGVRVLGDSMLARRQALRSPGRPASSMGALVRARVGARLGLG